MDDSALVRLMAQHEMLLWLQRDPGWVHDAVLSDGMDLTVAEVRRFRDPLVSRGLVEVCVGASRVTDLGRAFAGELLWSFD